MRGRNVFARAMGDHRVLVTCFKLTLFLTLLTLGRSQDHSEFCKRHDLCGDRGACATERDNDDKTDLPLRCFCVAGYHGRWCQFKEKRRITNDESNDGTPQAPEIVTVVKNFEKAIKIFWKQSDASKTTTTTTTTPILYYVLRYRQLGRGDVSWVTMETLASEGTTYSAVLENVDWGKKYLIEIYAGNSRGVGAPAVRVIRKPRAFMPRLEKTSEHPLRHRTVTSGGVLVLGCEALGVPRPVITWRLDGADISGNEERRQISQDTGELKVFEAGVEDEGSYRCLATNVVGTVRSTKIDVKLTVPGRFKMTENRQTAKPIVLNVELGRSYELRCPPYSRAHAEDIQWGNMMHNDTMIIGFPVSKRVWVTRAGSLYFAKVEQRDLYLMERIGGVRCIIVTAGGSERTMSNLFIFKEKGNLTNVNQPLEFVTKPSNARVVLGGVVVLHCASIADSSTVIRWIKGEQYGAYLENNDKYAIHDFGRTLEVRDFNHYDVGPYTCVTYRDTNGSRPYEGDILPQHLTRRNRKQVEKVSAHVSVHGTRPHVRKMMNRTVCEGSSIQWECHVSGNPTPTINWHYNGMLITDESVLPDKNVHAFQETLNIENIGRTQFGIYECTASNKHGEATSAAYLDVKGACEYQVMPETNTITSAIGSTVTLPCQVSGTTATWFKESSKILGNDEKFQEQPDGSLVISHVTYEDARDYTCEIYEKDFRTQRHITLKVFKNIDGMWSSWGPWSACGPPTTRGCVKYPRVRSRECNVPAPKNHGKYCPGSHVNYTECTQFPLCSSVSALSPWGAWTACFPSCGYYRYRSRHRRCTELDSAWNKCKGSKLDVEMCDAKLCPVSDLTTLIRRNNKLGQVRAKRERKHTSQEDVPEATHHHHHHHKHHPHHKHQPYHITPSEDTMNEPSYEIAKNANPDEKKSGKKIHILADIVGIVSIILVAGFACLLYYWATKERRALQKEVTRFKNQREKGLGKVARDVIWKQAMMDIKQRPVLNKVSAGSKAKRKQAAERSDNVDSPAQIKKRIEAMKAAARQAAVMKATATEAEVIKITANRVTGKVTLAKAPCPKQNRVPRGGKIVEITEQGPRRLSYIPPMPSLTKVDKNNRRRGFDATGHVGGDCHGGGDGHGGGQGTGYYDGHGGDQGTGYYAGHGGGQGTGYYDGHGGGQGTGYYDGHGGNVVSHGDGHHPATGYHGNGSGDDDSGAVTGQYTHGVDDMDGTTDQPSGDGDCAVTAGYHGNYGTCDSTLTGDQLMDQGSQNDINLPPGVEQDQPTTSMYGTKIPQHSRIGACGGNLSAGSYVINKGDNNVVAQMSTMKTMSAGALTPQNSTQHGKMVSQLPGPIGLQNAEQRMTDWETKTEERVQESSVTSSVLTESMANKDREQPTN